MEALRRWLAPLIFFVLPLAYLPGVMSPSVAGRWAVVAVGAALLLLTVSVRPTPTAAAAGLALAWMAAGLAWSSSPVDTAGGLVHWAALMALVVWASEQRDLKLVWTTFVVGTAASLPFAAAQWLGYHPVADVGATGFGPIGGLFLTSNVLAEVATLALVACLAARGPWRWPLTAACAAMALMAGRREAVMMLGAALVAYLLTKGRRRAALAVAAAGVGAAIVFYTVYPDRLVTLTLRLDMWRETVEGLTVFGAGLNTFTNFHPSFPFAHSDPLQMLFELGVGAAPVVWIAGRALGSGPALERCMLAGLCASAAVWFPMEDPVTAAVACVLAGRLSGERDRRERAEPVRRAARVLGRRHFGLDAARAVRPDSGGGRVVPARPQPALGG